MQKNILITGANRGIGLGLVNRYLEADYKVFAACRKPETATELWQLQKSHPQQLELVQLDLNQAADIKKTAQQFDGKKLDILVNNAGIFVDHGRSFEALGADDLRTSFETNVIAPLLLTQALLPALQRSSQPILAMMSSLMGSIGDNSSGGSYAYRSSKAALNMMSKTISIEYPWLTTIVLHPGWVQTDMGGASAPLDILSSTRGLWTVLDQLNKKDSGRFLSYAGKELAW